MVTMTGWRVIDPDVLAPDLVGIERLRLPEMTFRMLLVDGMKLVCDVKLVP